jgi:dTDP-3-amino-3,4,6-trideoxy-alpha-D-glucose transaminase
LVLSNNEPLIERIKLIRKGGVNSDGMHIAAGVNSRLDELQAAVLRAKLPHLEDWNRRRVALAAKYHEGLRGTRARPCLPVTSPETAPSFGADHNYHLYVIRHPERDRLRSFLHEKGIQALIHYPHPLHRHAAFFAFARPDAVLRVAEQACAEILSLPLYPELREEEQSQVIATICEHDRLH